MSEPPPPPLDARRVLEEDRRLQKDRLPRRGGITRSLLGYCLKRCGDAARAEDAAQEALELVLLGVGWHRWVHDGGDDPAHSLLRHLCDVANDVLRKGWGKDARSKEVLARGNADEREEPKSDPDVAADDARAVESERAEQMRLAQLVLDRLDAPARAMLALEQEGIHDAAAIAAQVKCTVKDVYRMRERVAYHRDKVLEEERGKRGGA